MKKIYKNPTLTVVKLQPARIMAGSFNEQLGNTGVDGGVSLGREATFSDWGEDVDLSEWGEKNLFVE